MISPLKALAAAAALAGALAAHASVISFESAPSTAGVQLSANDYRSVVNAAMAQPGAQSALVSVFDGLSSQGLFGGNTSDLAYRITVNFQAASAGVWDLRAGVDFGRGGALFLDGVALDFKSTDMWWNGSYADPSQSFQLSGLALSAGAHTLQLYGLEGCCDGGQQAQFRFNGGSFTTFASNDGLTAPVPEPAGAALMLAGLAIMGLRAARRRAI